MREFDPMNAGAPIAFPDPRIFPDAASAPAGIGRLYELAEEILGADTRLRAVAPELELRAALALRLNADGASLAAMLAGSPSVAVARHLWRVLDGVWRDTSAASDGVAMTVFAIPVVVVAGIEGKAGGGTLPGILEDVSALSSIIIEHRALAGNRTFALANVLVGMDAIDVPRLPQILAWLRLPDAPADGPAFGAAGFMQGLAPAPIHLTSGQESVSLRFLVGTAIAKPGVDLLADTKVGKWGVPLTRALGQQLGGGAVPVLALPRAPQRLLPAVQQGRAAQREVGAQIFVSNAVRRLRAAVGEPSAVISAHRAPGAPGGGELRLSLSSPFEPRSAEGFRCPLYPLDQVGDVATMLVELLRDCRVTDVRLQAGVHADRDARTGLTLLFKSGSAMPEIH